MSKRFCPKCGATSKQMLNGFCINCYVEDHKDMISIPDRIEVDSCPRCLRIRVRGKWISGKEDNMYELVTTKVKAEIERPKITVTFYDETPKGAIYLVNVKGSIKHEPLEFEKYTEVVFNKKLCNICSKKGTTYYEALVQLRPKAKEADIKKIREAFIMLRNENRAQIKTDRKAEIFRFENVKNGIDVFFGSQRSAKIAIQRLLQSFHPVVKETYTLVGIDKNTGKKRYTVTYSVRL